MTWQSEKWAFVRVGGYFGFGLAVVVVCCMAYEELPKMQVIKKHQVFWAVGIVAMFDLVLYIPTYLGVFTLLLWNRAFSRVRVLSGMTVWLLTSMFLWSDYLLVLVADTIPRDVLAAHNHWLLIRFRTVEQYLWWATSVVPGVVTLLICCRAAYEAIRWKKVDMGTCLERTGVILGIGWTMRAMFEWYAMYRMPTLYWP